jgi:protein-tyrosine kinase
MSKIYEALQNAHKHRSASENLPVLPPSFHEISREPVFHMEEEMLGLYKSIDALLLNNGGKIVQFIGAGEGEGTSTVAREFARICAARIGHSVLLLDADRHSPVQSAYFHVGSERGWIAALQKGDALQDSVYRIGQSRLFVSPSCNSAVSTPELFNSPRFEDFWVGMREEYDLILIDSAPLAISPDGLAIAAKADGVVLVVEAEKTRWQTAKNLRDSIKKIGGNVIGLVFNKRRYYIPQFVYKHL